MARPKYDESMISKAFAAAQNNATDKDIFTALGISKGTYYDWLNKHPDFLDAIKRGKSISDDLVEDSLFKRACGFEYEEVETIVEVGKDGQSKPVKVKKTKKRFAPDATAAIIWLKHRRKTKWGDRQLERDPEEDAKIDHLIESMEAAARASIQSEASAGDAPASA